MLASSLRQGTATAFVLLLGILSACSRSSPAHPASAKPAPSAPREATPPDASHRDAALAVTAPASSLHEFVGEMQTGSTMYFAVREKSTGVSAWYRVGATVGPFVIAGLENGRLLLKSADALAALPLTGVSVASSPPPPPGSATDTSGPAIEVWSHGQRIQVTPETATAALLDLLAQSKEPILRALAAHRDSPSPDSTQLTRMLEDALVSNTTVVGSAADGFRRSDFPPDLAAKLDEQTLQQINAAVQSAKSSGPHPNPEPSH